MQSPKMNIDKSMKRRLTRNLGLRRGRVTEFNLRFALVTPKRDYLDPAVDEVMTIDLLDAISRHLMEFHDVPGFKLRGLNINKKKVL